MSGTQCDSKKTPKNHTTLLTQGRCWSEYIQTTIQGKFFLGRGGRGDFRSDIKGFLAFKIRISVVLAVLFMHLCSVAGQKIIKITTDPSFSRTEAEQNLLSLEKQIFNGNLSVRLPFGDQIPVGDSYATVLLPGPEPPNVPKK